MLCSADGCGSRAIRRSVRAECDLATADERGALANVGGRSPLLRRQAACR